MNKRIISLVLAIVSVFALSCSGFASVGTRSIEIGYNDIKIELNGKVINPTDANGNAVEPFIYNGTTYLPVRGVGNALGLDVNWNASTRTVVLTGSPDGVSSSAPIDIFYPEFSVPKLDSVVGSYAYGGNYVLGTGDSIAYYYNSQKFENTDYLKKYGELLQSYGFSKDSGAPASFSYTNHISRITVAVSIDQLSGIVTVLVMALPVLDGTEIELMAKAFQLSTDLHDLCNTWMIILGHDTFGNNVVNTIKNTVKTLDSYIEVYNSADRGYSSSVSQAFQYVYDQLDLAGALVTNLSSYAVYSSSNYSSNCYELSTEELGVYSDAQMCFTNYFSNLS